MSLRRVPLPPESLQMVLASPHKLELLCLLQAGPAAAGDLAARMTRPCTAQVLEVHLRALQDRGWIRVHPVQRHGPPAPCWALIDPAANWLDYLHALRRLAPRPATR